MRATRKLSGELDSLLYIIANTVRGEFPLSVTIKINPETHLYDAVIELITRDEYYKSGFCIDIREALDREDGD